MMTRQEFEIAYYCFGKCTRFISVACCFLVQFCLCVLIVVAWFYAMKSLVYNQLPVIPCVQFFVSHFVSKSLCSNVVFILASYPHAYICLAQHASLLCCALNCWFCYSSYVAYFIACITVCVWHRQAICLLLFIVVKAQCGAYDDLSGV